MPPQSAPYSVPSMQKSGLPRAIVVALVGVVLLAIIGAGVWFYQQQYALSPLNKALGLSKEQHVSVALGVTHIATLFTVSGDGVLEEILIPGSEPLVVLDRVVTDTDTYYLLLNQETFVSNLYREGDEGLTQITTSDTFKFNLTHSTQTGAFAYSSGVVTSIEEIVRREAWDITLYSASGIEEPLGEGNQPRLDNEGKSVFAITEGKLRRFFLSRQSFEILNMQPGASYTLSADDTMLALYNPVTRAIERYRFTSGAGVSYERSESVATPPTALTFVGDRLLAALVASEGTPITLQFIGETASTSIENPYLPAVPRKLLVQ